MLRKFNWLCLFIIITFILPISINTPNSCTLKFADMVTSIVLPAADASDTRRRRMLLMMRKRRLASEEEEDYSDITLWINADGSWSSPTYTLDGTDEYSGGDTTCTANSSFAPSADAVKSGTNGFDVPSSSDYCTFDPNQNEMINQAEGALGFWFYVNTWDNNAFIFKIDWDDNDDIMNCALSTNDELSCRYESDGSGINIVTDGASLTTGNWYFGVYKWDPANDIAWVYVYNSAGTLIDSASGDPPAAIDDTDGSEWFWLGNNSAETADIYIDQFIASDDYDRDIHALRDIDDYPG